jgi:hypothetical protein
VLSAVEHVRRRTGFRARDDRATVADTDETVTKR